MKGHCCITIDCDSLNLYESIYGLDTGGSNVVYERGLLRFLNLFQKHGINATLFVVGQDLENVINKGLIREFARQGHEVASHTYTHPYEFIKMDRMDKAREIADSKAAIEAVTGTSVRGFRAPGYNIDKVAIELLRDQGFTYDSSILPSAEYYLLRSFMITKMRLQGRRSGSSFGCAKNFLKPNKPHELHGLRELPISVVGRLRFPMVGTFLSMLGEKWVTYLLPFLAGQRYLNIEFHAIDLIDFHKDGLAPEHEVIRETLIPLATKTAIYDRLFEFLAGHFRFTTLGGLPEF